MVAKVCRTPSSPRPRHARGGGSGFFWFVTGAVVGAFGMGLWSLLHDPAPPPDATASRTQANRTPASQAPAKPAAEPRFVFHDLLPEMQVPVPGKEPDVATPSPSQPLPGQQTGVAQPAPPPMSQPIAPPAPRQAPPQVAMAEQAPAKAGPSYLIQVASLRKVGDAEQLKARLALLGMRTNIQQVTVNGKEYHRVRAGPYQGTQEMKAARALLSSRGMESIPIRLK